MQDPTPMPWGALDRFQAHFIVSRDSDKDVGNFVAKTKLTTKGHFGTKSVVKVEWVGSGSLATKLNDDSQLNDLIAQQSIKDATIYVEPTDGAVRIRSKWDNHIDFGVSKELFEIYDKIAGHIKEV